MESSADITRKILRKVRQIEIRTNRMVTDAMAGAYHSVFKGQGMDFEEVREYAHGDDVRFIDWNVTAKMDKPFIKKFREERELTIILMVDLSASGNYGSVDQSKREIAAEIASVLAFSATRNNDKVGLILFSDKIENFIPPKKGRQHVLHIIRQILFFQPNNKLTDIPFALDYLNRVIKRKAVVFLLSDFIQDSHTAPILDNTYPELDPLLRNIETTNHRHDLICITITDPKELALPKIGIITVEDAETGHQVQLDTYNSHVRTRYARENQNRIDSFHNSLRRKGLDTLIISTDEPYINPLRKFLQKRLTRRSR